MTPRRDAADYCHDKFQTIAEGFRQRERKKERQGQRDGPAAYLCP